MAFLLIMVADITNGDCLILKSIKQDNKFVILIVGKKRVRPLRVRYSVGVSSRTNAKLFGESGWAQGGSKTLSAGKPFGQDLPTVGRSSVQVSLITGST